MVDDRKRGWKLSVSYLSIGIGLILISLVAAGILSYRYRDISQIITAGATLVSTAGVTLIIIALVEGRLLGKTTDKIVQTIEDSSDQTSDKIVQTSADIIQKSLDKTSNKIVQTSADNLDAKFKETFKILEHSRDNGLVDILAPRQDEEMGDATREIIAKEIEKSRLIYLFSITGLDFFRRPSGAGAPAGKYYMVIWERIQHAKKEKKPLELQIKALLMNPESDAGKIRNIIETFGTFQGTIDDDIKMATEGISVLNDAYGEPFIESVLYSEFPQTGFILTDSYVFVEPYHYAPTEEFCDALRKHGLKAATVANNCTGGRVPVLQFDNKSNIYLAMKIHFNFIWKHEKAKKGP